ncbi:MAG: phage integrase SAM-like domain-containing protein, partial [Treponema sp.]|nr:phage integrase SAM-like domain-containing protein [Treponema sp.]
MRSDYVLYKEKYAGQLYWRARFRWDEQTGKYLISRNLGVPAEGKRERRREAEDAAEQIVKELNNEPVDDKFFISYLEAFWSPGSNYIEEQARVNKTPLCSMYIVNNLRQIRLHISPCPLFTGLLLTDLSRKIIRDYKLWGAKKGMSGRLINQCLQTMRVAVRYAVANEELPADPFYGAGKVYHK